METARIMVDIGVKQFAARIAAKASGLPMPVSVTLRRSGGVDGSDSFIFRRNGKKLKGKGRKRKRRGKRQGRRTDEGRCYGVEVNLFGV